MAKKCKKTCYFIDSFCQNCTQEIDSSFDISQLMFIFIVHHNFSEIEEEEEKGNKIVVCCPISRG